jgi:endonuclease/exonuclease/phosphatase family metal-dependent hydrolase
MMNRSKMVKVFLKSLLALVLVITALFALFLGYLSIFEYRPGNRDPIALEYPAPGADRVLSPGDSLKLLSWNIGYASLDASQDFFMDGGKSTMPLTGDNVVENLRGIQDYLNSSDWDILLIQEADLKSRRSYNKNQVEYLSRGFSGSAAFGYNYNSRFVPYPIPNFFGPIESGLLTLNHFTVSEALRISLPNSFTWPVRLANLKRCLLVERIPLRAAAGGAAELVIVNLHLEAYGDSSGREAQTRSLLEFLYAEYAKGNYVIAGGDFNQTFPGIDPGRFAIKNAKYFLPGLLREEMLEPRWRFAFDPNAPSARLLNEPYSGSYDNTQLYIIDGFILSPNVELRSVKTDETGFRYSDHHPVTLEVTLRGTPGAAIH